MPMTEQYAKILGNLAYARGDRRVPAQDAEYMKGLNGVPLGGGAHLSRAWLGGWDETSLAAKAAA